jgi:hypothetical protein
MGLGLVKLGDGWDGVGLLIPFYPVFPFFLFLKCHFHLLYFIVIFFLFNLVY